MTDRALLRFPFLVLSVAFLGGACLTVSNAGVPKPKKPKVVFNRDIRPILSKCLTCHGNDKNAITAGLRFDTREGAIAKLPSGKRAIVPGHSSQSELVKRIKAGKDSGIMMPPESSNKILSKEEKELLIQWIDEGAEFKPHWAFVPPVRPPLPEVKNQKWARNEIDRFILAKLEENNLKPSPEADRATLLRRVTLDLIGLPPTPGEVNAFMADKSPNAYEKVVDRLLASPRYAERMAMDWMDYSRYADSNGYQADYERFQWRWRDWVLDAFNKNMPYDQFTVEQLAGDMLPNATLDQKIASGFNRNHRINTEGGVVVEEWRVETVIDRVETTSTVWLGLTSGCARCHDHKYDPLSQREFYGMFAYFNNVTETGSGEERPINHPPFIKAPRPGELQELSRLQMVSASLENQVKQVVSKNVDKSADWKLPNQSEMPSLRQGVSARYSFASGVRVTEGSAIDPRIMGAPKFDMGHSGTLGAVSTSGDNFLDLGDTGNFERDKPFSYAAWINPRSLNGSPFSKMDAGDNFKGWDLYLAGGKVSVHLINQWPANALKVTTRAMLPAQKWAHIAVTYDGSQKPEGLKVYINGQLSPTDTETNALTQSIKTAVSLKVGRRTGADVFDGSVEDLALYNKVLTQGEIVGLSGSHPAQSILAIAPDKRTPAQRELLALLWTRENDTEFKRLDDQRVATLQESKKLEDSIPTVMVMEEMKKPRPAYILIRGQYDKRGKEVTPTVPSALPPLPKGYPNNRLGFAKWIVSPDNPLTARVTVNRFWERFFGTGIVATIEDFGTRAEYPSHPELLDWLATEFMGSKWNVKALLKKMVMSATYRQSPKVTTEVARIDPANRLLARGPRFRLPAEVLRDQALMAAGLLVNKMGGPSVRPYQPDGIWDETNVYGNLRNYKPDMGDGRYRRSLYTIWKRTAAPPDMTLFDVSSRETCRVRRPRTNTPLQALTLMNDVTYVEAARGLAQRTLKEGGKNADSRIRFMMMSLLARTPTASEAKILSTGLQKRLDKYKLDPKSAEKLLKVGDLPSDKSLPVPELAAYTLLASTMMNLDEVVTKE